jgi:hypothetical protein
MPLSENATPDEIETQGVMRIRRCGLETQYALIIAHEFGGAWAGGFLENIANPSPRLGKHWIDENDVVVAKVDGVIQNLNGFQGRLICTGYVAEGAPNHYTNYNQFTYYTFEKISEFQTVPPFRMNKPAKIKYDWNLQYEVTINTLPDGFDNLVSIDIIGDENQPGYTGTGKFWFNKNSELIIRAKDSDCMILSGYRDNTIFPGFNKSITKNCYWKDHKGQAWAISGSGDPVSIESATLFASNNDETTYSIRLKSPHVLIHNELYSIEVTDHRGIVGYAKFRIGVTDPDDEKYALDGIYEEKITGLHKQPISIAGSFNIQHVSVVDILNDGKNQ